MRDKHLQAYLDEGEDGRTPNLHGLLAMPPAHVTLMAVEDVAAIVSGVVRGAVHASISRNFAGLVQEDPEVLDTVEQLLALHAPRFEVSPALPGLQAWLDGLREADDGYMRRLGVCLAYLRSRPTFQPHVYQGA